MNETPQTLIVFFDGICHLCNGFVDFMSAREMQRPAESRNLRFAPLQGETAKLYLSDQQRTSLETVIVRTPEGQHLLRSEAVLYLLSRSRGNLRFLSVFKYLPRTLRDGVYLLVARSRYRIWGRRQTCRMPIPGENSLLLP